MPNKQNDIDLEPLLGTQQNQLSLIMADGASIDTKALSILAADIAILIFIAQSSLGLRIWQYGILLGPYLVSLVLDILAIWPRRYLGASVDLGTHPEYLIMPKDVLLLQLLSDTKNAIEYNRRVNAVRWRFCLASIVLTFVGAVALFVIL